MKGLLWKWEVLLLDIYYKVVNLRHLMAGNIIKIFILKTLGNKNNLHAVTWQNWMWILPDFKSQVALY